MFFKTISKGPFRLDIRTDIDKYEIDLGKNDIACKELHEDGFSQLTPLTLERLQSKPINFWAFFYV